MSRCLPCFVFLAALAGAAPSSVRADDQDRFQGSWKIVFAEIGAKDKAGPKELTVEGSKLTIQEKDRKESAHFSLDPDSKPRHIDFYRNADKKEKIWHGIYAFDGKDLKLCWGPSNAERPTEFSASKSDHNRYLIVKKK